MPAHFNIAAFRATASILGVNHLAKAYCTCVHIELALKEVAPAGRWGHDIGAMLQRIQAHTPALTSRLPAHAAQFRSAINRLWCQSIKGLPEKARTDKYPDIRYVRHSSDWPTEASNDVDIQYLNSTLEMMLFFLRTNTTVPL
jgi:hypothetical protein